MHMVASTGASAPYFEVRLSVSWIDHTLIETSQYNHFTNEKGPTVLQIQTLFFLKKNQSLFKKKSSSLFYKSKVSQLVGPYKIKLKKNKLSAFLFQKERTVPLRSK